jgi:hypothetical protein
MSPRRVLSYFRIILQLYTSNLPLFRLQSDILRKITFSQIEPIPEITWILDFVR